MQIFLNFPKKQFAKISVYLISTVAKKQRLNWIFCFWFINNVIFSSSPCFYPVNFQFKHLQGSIQEFFRGGLHFFLHRGGGSAPVGPETPLKFHWSGMGLAPKPHPWIRIWPPLRVGMFNAVLRIRIRWIRKILASWIRIRIRKNMLIHGSGSASKLNGS